MVIRILAAGQMRDGPELTMTNNYILRFNRLGRQLGIGPVAVQQYDSSQTRALNQIVTRRRIQYSSNNTYILDHRGKTGSSEDFANMLSGHRSNNLKELNFIIGGPEGIGLVGLGEEFNRLSLGPMIFPHMLVRVIFAEQLYRAASILAGTPYHRA